MALCQLPRDWWYLICQRIYWQKVKPSTFWNKFEPVVWIYSIPIFCIMRSWPFWSGSKASEIHLLFCQTADSILLTLSLQWQKVVIQELTDSTNVNVQTNVLEMNPTYVHIYLSHHQTLIYIYNWFSSCSVKSPVQVFPMRLNVLFKNLLPLLVKPQPIQQEQKQALHIEDALLCFPVWKEYMREGYTEP